MSVVVHGLVATVVATRADLLPGDSDGSLVRTATRVVAAYLLLGIVVNLASRSRPERLVMSPLCAVLCASTTVVALA